MHPFLRNVVIGAVGLIIVGGLAVLAILRSDSGTTVLAMLAAGIVAALIGAFLFVQAWIWSRRSARIGRNGRAVAIALVGGLMILLAAGALAGAVLVVLLFYVA